MKEIPFLNHPIELMRKERTDESDGDSMLLEASCIVAEHSNFQTEPFAEISFRVEENSLRANPG